MNSRRGGRGFWKNWTQQDSNSHHIAYTENRALLPYCHHRTVHFTVKPQPQFENFEQVSVILAHKALFCAAVVDKGGSCLRNLTIVIGEFPSSLDLILLM
jgi:hypothetical protein